MKNLAYYNINIIYSPEAEFFIMKAESIYLLVHIINPNGRLFRIPVYQRNYDWSEDHCKRLLDDIERIINGHQQKHFLGSMVYLASNDGGMFQNFIVIDGQQRLTTVMIILKALCECAKKLDDINTLNLITGILYNSNFSESRLKLKASMSDDKNFAALLEDRLDDIDKDSRILINH